MPTIWTYVRAAAVLAGSGAALLTGGIAHADPAPAQPPAPNIPQRLIASAANAPQILQNLATALGATRRRRRACSALGPGPRRSGRVEPALRGSRPHRAGPGHRTGPTAGPGDRAGSACACAGQLAGHRSPDSGCERADPGLTAPAAPAAPAAAPAGVPSVPGVNAPLQLTAPAAPSRRHRERCRRSPG